MTSLARSATRHGSRIVVFNPLPWQRAGVVRLRFPETPPATVRPATADPPWPSPERADEIVFLARAISRTPATCLSPRSRGPTCRAPPGPRSRTASSRNETLRVVLDPVRRRSSFAGGQDRRPGTGSTRTLPMLSASTSTSGSIAIGGPLRRPMSRASDGRAGTGQAENALAEELTYRRPRQGLSTFITNVAVAETLTMEIRPSAGVLHGLTLKVIFYMRLPYLDLELTVSETGGRFRRAGWVCLPARIDGGTPRFRIGRLGAVVDPACDFVRGSNHNLALSTRGSRSRDASGRGLAFCPIDSPLVSLDSPGIFKYDPGFVPERPVAFVNLFNNQWSTNFRLWNEGTWTSRIRIWPASGDDVERSLITPAIEVRLSSDRRQCCWRSRLFAASPARAGKCTEGRFAVRLRSQPRRPGNHPQALGVCRSVWPLSPPPAVEGHGKDRSARRPEGSTERPRGCIRWPDH